MHSLKVNGLNIAYLEEGSGPPVVLAHCSSASHKEWLPLIDILKEQARVIAPDLIGYGRSDHWPSMQPLDLEADARVILALIKRADEPVDLVGHSYGASMALQAARLAPDMVKTLTLVEPVSFQLLSAAGRHKEYGVIEKLAGRVTSAMAQEKRRAAAAAYMGFWIGRMRWWGMPAALRIGVIKTIDKVAKEFESLGGVPAHLDQLAKLQIPTRLILGGKTKAPAKAVIEILSETLPQVEVKTIKGAGHMSPFTHVGEVNKLIIEHIENHKVMV